MVCDGYTRNSYVYYKLTMIIPSWEVKEMQPHFVVNYYQIQSLTDSSPEIHMDLNHP